MKNRAARIALLTGVLMGTYMLPAYAEVNAEKVNSVQNIVSENKEAEKQQLQKEIEQFKQQLQLLDQEIAKTQTDLESTQEQIQQNKDAIALKKQNIEALQQKMQQRQVVIKKRLVALQSQPKDNLITDIFTQSRSIADLLDSMYSLNLIFKSDEAILKDQQSDEEMLQKEKNSMEDKEQALRSYETSLQEKQQQLEKSQKEKIGAIAALEQKLGRTLSGIMDEEEEKQLLGGQSIAGSGASGTIQSGSKIFIKPAAGTISSNFGTRGNENHKGIDIAASGPVPIVAAASGTVIRSEYSSSYGNVVYLSHNLNGKTYTTVYAHMRSRSVQQGQVVQQGQQLGVMGNTGMSHGQHLHFELHVGSWNAAKSNAVNPISFLQ
ncbi:murein hydrolase activator EnvC family protein [Ectobacillus panaciterrae]|uniref:murein hydrolase activator EnvC family protein n=1 Tax=Ectobacillus panaciterrae TaxID=363872 RepID=UPI0004288496|nr:peptidoglycan DD-metalloendopeptidase family protein [Ectobacillus panaciterrae]